MHFAHLIVSLQWKKGIAMNICIVAAPIVRAIENAKAHGRDIDYTLIYTGAREDPTLELSLFEDLQIAPPQVFLGVECENLNELTGQVMSAFEHYLQENPTDVVIVVDDLASTMAAAIVTKKQGITLAHLVAGTRSFDIKMPKEINRLVIDGLSDLLFTAGMGANSIATREGAELSKIYCVGNILMDTLRFNRDKTFPPAPPFRAGSDYLVFTLNRKALIADEENLGRMLQAIVENAQGMPIYAPLRSRAKEVVERWSQEPPKIGGWGSGVIRGKRQEARGKKQEEGRITFLPPLSYLEFGWLTAHARGIITDSGNVAEEATFNGVPCITLNSYTEHIETVKVGTNVLGEMVGKMVRGEWKHGSLPDRWDGRTAERIVQIIEKLKS